MGKDRMEVGVVATLAKLVVTTDVAVGGSSSMKGGHRLSEGCSCCEWGRERTLPHE